MREKTKKEPPFHIVKRDALPWYTAWGVRIGAILLAIIVCGLLTLFLTGENPFSVYGTMIKGVFGSERRIWNTLQSLAMLLCVSLAVTPAFKMRFWNIGAEGQVLVGGLATAACMILLGGKVPNALLILIMIAASIIAGVIWAVLPAVFKAKFNTNETLFTLMMNYVAIQLVSYFTMYCINVKKVIIRTMALSGAVCGIAGLLLVGGTNHTITTTISEGRGFTAIMVAWLAKFNPIVMILTSFLLVFFERGAGEIATVFALNQSFSDIISGVVLFFIIGSEFFINYKLKFHHSHKEVK